jgi:hypothetical protein
MGRVQTGRLQVGLKYAGVAIRNEVSSNLHIAAPTGYFDEGSSHQR